MKTVRALVLVAVACAVSQAAAQPQKTPDKPAAAEPAATTPVPAAVSALDAMDPRKPVYLLPMMAAHQKQNMRDHLLAVQEILAALDKKDFAAVQKAAARIGTSDQMMMMCNHMGAATPGFTDVALGFHKTADGIGEAAKKKDAKATQAAVVRTLGTCTSCHEAYKQVVVDEATWTKLAGTPAPGPGMHHP